MFSHHTPSLCESVAPFLQELRKQCQDFATALLDHTRSSYELEVLLNHDPTGPAFEHGERMHLNRLKLAIKLRQKKVHIYYFLAFKQHADEIILLGSCSNPWKQEVFVFKANKYMHKINNPNSNSMKYWWLEPEILYKHTWVPT